jgi:hypothetical protein
VISILEGDRVTVQTFRDHSGAQGYAEIRSGSLGPLRVWYEPLNAAGMGVFYAVNEMLPGRRGRENVVQVNAYYVDIDGLRYGMEKDIASEKLLLSVAPPNVIVYTRNGVQALWMVSEGRNDSEEYKFTELGLIHAFGGDGNAKDIARVLRMPGTYHMKNPDDPYLCSVMYADESLVYSEDYLREVYPAPVVAPPVAVAHRRVERDGTADEWEEILREYEGWRGVPGVRHDTLLIAAGNAVRCGVSESRALRDLLPIVESWRSDSRMARQETEGAVRFAYAQNVPYSRKALQNRLR